MNYLDIKKFYLYFTPALVIDIFIFYIIEI